jgi:hypothetical protein
MSGEVKRLADLNSREWELLAHNAESLSRAMDATGQAKSAAYYKERARSFNAWAAREEEAQTRFETTGETTLSRDDVNLDDVERVMREALEAAKQRNDGVERLALAHALGFLKAIYGDEIPIEGADHEA